MPDAAISGFENSTPAIFTDKSAIKIAADKAYDYVFMSPIYDSISKVNYYSTYTAEELRDAQRTKIIDSKVMALGGINADNLLEIKDFGFGGAVILGDLWNRFDACSDQDYLAVIEHFKKLKKLAD